MLLHEEHDNALSFIDSSIDKHGKLTELIRAKANILSARKEYNKAMAILKDCKLYAQSYWIEGYKHLIAGNFTKSVNSLKKVIKLEPDNVRAMILISNSIILKYRTLKWYAPILEYSKFVKLKKGISSAIDLLLKAIDITPKDESHIELEMAYSNLSVCYLAVCEFENAIKTADCAINVKRTSSVPFFNKALAQIKLGDFRAALDNLQLCELLSGDSIDISHNMAFCFLQIGELDKAAIIIDAHLERDSVLNLDFAELAIDYYFRSLSRDNLSNIISRLEHEYPDDSHSLRLRASHLIRLKLGDPETLLLRSFKNARTDHESGLAELDLGNYYFAKKHYKDAMKYYSKYAYPTIENPIAVRYAECLYYLGNYATLLEWIDSLDPKVRENLSLLKLQAFSNLHLKNLQIASDLFKRLFVKQPSDLTHIINYGMCRFRLGFKVDTKNAFDIVRANVLDSKDLISMSFAYIGIGENDIAMELALKAVNMEPNNSDVNLAYLAIFLRCDNLADHKIGSLYISKFHHIMSEFSNKFPDDARVRKLTLSDVDIKYMFEEVDKKAEAGERALFIYRKMLAPLALIPSATGNTPYEVWYAFIRMEDIIIRVNEGRLTEIEEETSLIADDAISSFVFDIYPLFFLSYTDNLEFISKISKRIVVHQSILDEISFSLDDLEISLRGGGGIIGKHINQYFMISHDHDELRQKYDLLKRLNDFLVRSAAVEIRGARTDYGQNKSTMFSLIHNSTLDSAFLAKELNTPLCCDDYVLRILVKSEYNIRSFSTQSLIGAMLKSNMITYDVFHSIVDTMYRLNYRHIYIDARYILYEIEKHPYTVRSLKTVISILTSNGISVSSIVNILADLYILLCININISRSIKIYSFIYLLKCVLRGVNGYAIKSSLIECLTNRTPSDIRDSFRKNFINIVNCAL